MTDNRPLISVVLSFFNEEEVLDELIERLHKALRPLPIEYELLFVDDASTDRSPDILRRHAAADSHIKVLTMSRNFGGARQGVCILAGIEHAAGDAVIYMDTDLQDPPELLPELIRVWMEDEHAEVVYTTRRSRAGESVGKKIITKIGYRVLHRFCNVDFPVDSGDFKLVSRRAAEAMLRCGDKWPFLRGLVPWVGFKQVQVFYDRLPRAAGDTKYRVLSRCVINNFLFGIIGYSDAPLKAALWVGGGLCTGAVLYLAVLGIVHACGIDALCRVNILLFAVLLLGGVQLTMFGVLGLYISVISDQVRDRPRYIVGNKIGFGDG